MAEPRDMAQNTSESALVMANAQSALTAMQRHGIAPNPRNFALWYTHYGAHFPDLSQAIDGVINSGEPFTPARNEELYLNFLMKQPDAEQVGKITERFGESLQRMQGSIDRSRSATIDYGRTLDDCSDQLAANESEALRGMITRLVQETRQMSEHTRLLEEQLTRSRGEVAALRENLADLQQETLTDTLTGIANRRAFDLRLGTAAATALETGEPLSLLILDIDHFKLFNDTHGHQTGDQVLRLVAQTLTDSVKGRDIAARYGGEEFAIILPQTNLAGAVALADNIRVSVMGRRIVRKSRGDVLGTITLSTGASQYRAGERLSETVRRADAAMYRAKAAGRNCVRDETTPTDEARPEQVAAAG